MMEKKLCNLFDGECLLCPYCGGNYLHHEKVEVFDCEEGEIKGLHVLVDRNKKLTVDTDLSENPSRYRHGLLIHFSCETCDYKPVLELSQHKGVTLMEFQDKEI